MQSVNDLIWCCPLCGTIEVYEDDNAPMCSSCGDDMVLMKLVPVEDEE